MTIFLVFMGGMVGAPLRYVMDLKIQSWHVSVFPWGTLSVNVLGGFIVGALLGLNVSTPVHLLLATGLSGALTTYSTFSYETLRLFETKHYGLALSNVMLSIGLAVGATYLGFAIAA